MANCYLETSFINSDTQLMKPNFNRTDREHIFGNFVKKYRPAQSVEIFGHPYYEMDIMMMTLQQQNNVSPIV